MSRRAAVDGDTETIDHGSLEKEAQKLIFFDGQIEPKRGQTLTRVLKGTHARDLSTQTSRFVEFASEHGPNHSDDNCARGQMMPNCAQKKGETSTRVHQGTKEGGRRTKTSEFLVVATWEFNIKQSRFFVENRRSKDRARRFSD